VSYYFQFFFQVQKFLEEWKSGKTGEKRKSELLEEMKKKVAKIS
jgi:hypothetical protein